MPRSGRLAILSLFAALVVAGCQVPLGPWGGPAYDLNPTNVGSGQQAISPRNDSEYWNGEPVNARRK